MSPIIERIESEYKTAFKAHQQTKVNVLRLIKSALENAEIAARRDLNDEEVIAVLQREAKKRREAMALYQQGGRPEKSAEEQAELDEIARFLPAQMSDEELKVIVQATVTELSSGPADFGTVMGAVMKKVKGQVDGHRVSAAVKQVLK